MKKTLIAFTLMFCIQANAQITLSGSYSVAPTLVKFSNYGYKYLFSTLPATAINLYNPNHSLWKSITIPPQSFNQRTVMYVSDKLFDNDTLVEYAYYCSSMQSSPPYTVSAKIFIYEETGSLQQTIDSASYYFGTTYSRVFNNLEPVYYDGISAKMRCTIMGNGMSAIRQDIYNLPGTIPCLECMPEAAHPGVQGLKSSSATSSPTLYPNPNLGEVHLKYDLPEGFTSAEIKVSDTQGKVIESFKLGPDFNDIVLPANYGNGLYLYTVYIDGKAVKTDKILLNK